MTQGDLICIRCGQRGHVSAQCKQPIIEGPVSMLTVLVPIRIESEANRREHYYKVHDRKRAHAHAVGWVMKQHKPPAIAEDGQLVVVMTRIGARDMDSDNLAGGCKQSRDTLAKWLGLDDGDKRISWLYQQRRGKPKEYALEITLQWSELRACPAAPKLRFTRWR